MIHTGKPTIRILLTTIITAALNIGVCHAAEKISPGDQAKLATLKYETGIIYKTADGQALDMYLFLPKVKKYDKTPVMLFTHGGGWGGGDKFKVFYDASYKTLKIILDQGIACAAIEYRRVKNKSTAYECVIDCKDAARFLVKNADKYGLDPDRMGVWGDSAGGHLCLLTGLGRDEDYPGDPEFKGIVPKFRCIVSYYPLTTILKPELQKGSRFEDRKSFNHLIGGTVEQRQKEAILLSPAEQLHADAPPMLLLHGDNDKILSIENSIYFINTAKERGANAELLTVKNGGHCFSGKDISPSMDQINHYAADYIIKHLTAQK